MPSDLSTRQDQILELLAKQGQISIDALAAHFDVTTQTVRRDVNGLRDRGLLERVHSGVRRLTQTTPYDVREAEGVGAKARLARAVLSLLPADASVSIGIGSTPAEVARVLRGTGPREILTNNLAAACLLWDQDDIRLTTCGGSVRDRGLTGPEAIGFFESYRVDYAIYGVAGVDTDGALLDFRPEEAQTREAMRRNARHSILVLDQVKFKRRAMARAGWLGDVDYLVTNGRPPETLASSLAAEQLILAEEG